MKSVERKTMLENRVTVILSTYNGEKYLADQLDSILSQEGVEVTLLIRDDGSRDSTLTILRDFASRRENVQWIAGDNRGVAGSFLIALKQADSSSNFFAFSDQDDVWEPRKLANAVEALRAEGDTNLPLLYCSKLEIVDESLRHIGFTKRLFRDISFKNAVFQNIVYGCTGVMNRSARDLVVSTESVREILMHDWWCYLAVSAFGRVIFDDRSGIKYRQHGNNQIGARTSILGRIRMRCERTFRGLNGRFPSEQNSLFLAIYGQRLSGDKRRFMERTLGAKRSLRQRIELAASSEIVMQNRLDNFFTRVGILLNRF
jgi:glycosyltransferase involved in cell wall biosynthesis